MTRGALRRFVIRKWRVAHDVKPDESLTPLDFLGVSPPRCVGIIVNGIPLLENLRLDELAARRAHEFALILEPLKIQGGTGSTVAPIAIG